VVQISLFSKTFFYFCFFFCVGFLGGPMCLIHTKLQHLGAAKANL